MPGGYERLLPKDANPLKTNFISRLFFTWLHRLLKLGHRRSLTDDDLFELSDEHKAQDLVEDLNKLWMEEISSAEKKGEKPRLWKAVFKLFSWTDYCLLFVLKNTTTSVQLFQIISIWFYLTGLEDASRMNKVNGVGIVACISIISLVKALCYHHFDYESLQMGMRLKIAMIGLIHKKITECRRSNLSQFTTGHIMNLVSNDAKRMDDLAMAVSEVLAIPYAILPTVLLLYFLIGWQSFSGLLVIFVLAALNLLLIKLFAEIRPKQAKLTDQRLAAVSEIISGIRTIKMYAWEWKYNEMVDQLRRKEVNLINKKTLIESSITSMLFTVTLMATLASVCTLVYSGIRTNAVVIFTLTLLLDVCSECLEVKLGFHLLKFRDAKVSLNRMEEFLYLTCVHRKSHLRNGQAKNEENNVKNPQLLSHDRISCVKHAPITRNQGMDAHITVTDISASWSKDQQSVLHQISLTLTSNQLLMVTGPVGSGKTSLLMAILGEIPITEGTFQIHGRMAYVSQTPWIFSGSIRENIVFGRPFDDTRYRRILEICDLHKDIKCFPYEDLTIIGQRGVGLSGGQRARVSLARAAYSDADIFLMDDPLSAVDARVGQHILDKCICGELLNRTRILVTHQVQHLPRADKIAIAKEGTVVTGTYAELKDKGMLDNLQKRQEDVTCDKLLDSVGIHRDSEFAGKNTLEEVYEDRATGTVKWRVYWEFFRVGLPAVIIGLFIIFSIIVQVSALATGWWMSRIAHMSDEHQRSFFALGIFGGLVVGAFLLDLSREVLLGSLILRCIRKLHDKMMLALIKSPVLFFDTNPAGRIMNRFSEDIGGIDDLLPHQFNFAFCSCLNLLGVLVFATIISVWISLVVVPVLLMFFYLTRYYVKSSRELKRIEAVRRSPVYDHIAETIAGVEVIRTSEMENMNRNKMMRLQNEHNRAFFLVVATARWFGFYWELLCTLVLLAISILGLVTIQDHALSGMLLMLVMKVFGINQYGIRMATEVESQMTSVERVMTYSKLPPEPGYDRRDKAPDDWPNRGSLSIRNLSMVYLEGGPHVLRDVNLDVQPQEKIGIVGRTGAGKSSLVAALFRMPDPQGQVLIDGVDLGTISTQDARRSMAVITQDPVLFAGSLRKNLDPFNCFPDQAIWSALEQVQLMKKVSQLPHQLEFCVGEEGSGFSVGERQLLCLGRALLQKCKILVLDEATANVDYKTDQLIQQVIRQQFTNCTVLTIAHRLNTIMDYDKVVVLDQGRVVEYDNPRVLAEKENGFFLRLITTTPDNIG